MCKDIVMVTVFKFVSENLETLQVFNNRELLSKLCYIHTMEFAYVITDVDRSSKYIGN